MRANSKHISRVTLKKKCLRMNSFNSLATLNSILQKLFHLLLVWDAFKKTEYLKHFRTSTLPSQFTWHCPSLTRKEKDRFLCSRAISCVQQFPKTSQYVTCLSWPLNQTWPTTLTSNALFQNLLSVGKSKLPIVSIHVTYADSVTCHDVT